MKKHKIITSVKRPGRDTTYGGRTSCRLPLCKKEQAKEVVSMVTYEALFAYTTVIIAIIALVVSIFQNNK